MGFAKEVAKEMPIVVFQGAVATRPGSELQVWV